MIGFRVRDARSSDKAAVGEFWHTLMAFHQSLDVRIALAPDSEAKYVRHIQEMIRTRDARVLVAEEEATGKLVGFLVGEIQRRPPISLPGTYGFISDVYIQPEWRNRGVGKALFEEIKRWFCNRKAQAIELYVAEANPSAVAFWQAMGMQPYLRLLRQDLETPSQEV